ncbi:MAG: ABC transporter permease, partial [Myxococcaceae bacterium]
GGGGGGGALLGSAVSLAAASLSDWPIVLSVSSGALAVAFSTAVAVGFGSLPARRAANLDPATSLRSA